MRFTYENNPKEIIEELLKHHDIKELRAILNSKVRRKSPRINNYFTIAVEVYLMQYREDSKLEWAINKVSEERSISDKTIKNHLTKFRKEMKREIEKLPPSLSHSKEKVSDFIHGYIITLHDSFLSDNYNSLPEKDYERYKRVFHQYLQNIYDLNNKKNNGDDEIPFW